MGGIESSTIDKMTRGKSKDEDRESGTNHHT